MELSVLLYSCSKTDIQQSSFENSREKCGNIPEFPANRARPSDITRFKELPEIQVLYIVFTLQAWEICIPFALVKFTLRDL